MKSFHRRHQGKIYSPQAGYFVLDDVEKAEDLEAAPLWAATAQKVSPCGALSAILY